MNTKPILTLALLTTLISMRPVLVQDPEPEPCENATQCIGVLGIVPQTDSPKYALMVVSGSKSIQDGHCLAEGCSAVECTGAHRVKIVMENGDLIVCPMTLPPNPTIDYSQLVDPATPFSDCRTWHGTSTSANSPKWFWTGDEPSPPVPDRSSEHQFEYSRDCAKEDKGSSTTHTAKAAEGGHQVSLIIKFKCSGDCEGQ